MGKGSQKQGIRALPQDPAPLSSKRAQLIRERPPRLIQHMLTVLVFWSWVLLLPQLQPSSRSLRLFPWASILLRGPLDMCLDPLPPALLPSMQNGTHSTCLYSTGGHIPNLVARIARPISLAIWHRRRSHRRPNCSGSPNRRHFASLDLKKHADFSHRRPTSQDFRRSFFWHFCVISYQANVFSHR